MGKFIDNLEEWLDSLSDEELVKSWEKSTEGMSDNGHYVDFISESEVKLQRNLNRVAVPKSKLDKYNK